MDIQGVLYQKDAELDKRTSLLLKTKGAIEQLQDELLATRHEAEQWHNAADRSAAETADAQRQLQALELELQAKSIECSSMLADMLELKRKLQQTTDSLNDASDSHAEDRAELLAHTQELEKALAGAKSDAKAVRDHLAAVQAELAGRQREVEQQGGSLRQAEQQLGQVEATLQRERQEAAVAAEQLQAQLAVGKQQAEARLAAEVQARQQAEQAVRAAHDSLADEQKRRVLDDSAWERRLREAQQDAAERLQAREAAWAAQQGKARGESVAALEDCRHQLTKRMYVAEGEWAKKMQQQATEWASKLDQVCTEWRQRCDADKAAWDAERRELQDGCSRHLTEADRAHAAALDEAHRLCKQRVTAAEAKAASEVQAMERAWQQRLEAAAAKAESQLQATAQGAAAAAQQQEQQLRSQLAAAQEASAARLADLEKQWALKLAAAEERGLRERHELERGWSEKLHAAGKAASEAEAGLRSQLEARLATVSERIGSMVRKERRRERRTAQLQRRVVEAEAAMQAEACKRRDVEASLAEASTIFKRELADKNQQLDLLRQELRILRSWAGSEGAASAALQSSTQDGAPFLLTSRAPATSSVPLSPVKVNALCAASMLCSPAHHRCNCCSGAHVFHHCYSAPASPGVESQAGPAAARAVEAELKALRSAKRAYQRAALGQQNISSSVARTIHEALKQDSVGPSPLRGPAPPDAATIPAARRKWKRDLATELQDLCFAGEVEGH